MFGRGVFLKEKSFHSIVIAVPLHVSKFYRVRKKLTAYCRPFTRALKDWGDGRAPQNPFFPEKGSSWPMPLRKPGNLEKTARSLIMLHVARRVSSIQRSHGGQRTQEVKRWRGGRQVPGADLRTNRQIEGVIFRKLGGLSQKFPGRVGVYRAIGPIKAEGDIIDMVSVLL
jgi:hypothetical protein